MLAAGLGMGVGMLVAASVGSTSAEGAGNGMATEVGVPSAPPLQAARANASTAGDTNERSFIL